MTFAANAWPPCNANTPPEIETAPVIVAPPVRSNVPPLTETAPIGLEASVSASAPEDTAMLLIDVSAAPSSSIWITPLDADRQAEVARDRPRQVDRTAGEAHLAVADEAGERERVRIGEIERALVVDRACQLHGAGERQCIAGVDRRSA